MKREMTAHGAMVWVAVLGLVGTIITEVAWTWRDERRWQRKQEAKAKRKAA